jgi:hypothetical protein
VQSARANQREQVNPEHLLRILKAEPRASGSGWPRLCVEEPIYIPEAVEFPVNTRR